MCAVLTKRAQTRLRLIHTCACINLHETFCDCQQQSYEPKSKIFMIKWVLRGRNYILILKKLRGKNGNKRFSVSNFHFRGSDFAVFTTTDTKLL